jgi:hypothetical protein
MAVYTARMRVRHGGSHGITYRVGVSVSVFKANFTAYRQNKLFSPDSLPFNDFEDVREAFHSSVRSQIDATSLERAIHLTNLATFLWVILQPDEAHTLLGTEGRSKSGRSSRRLGAAAGDDEENQDIRDIVSRRNRVFGMAWKRYWKDVIPQGMRGNKNSINLWAYLSVQVSLSGIDYAGCADVQIIMMFRQQWVDAKQHTGATVELPNPDPEVAAELFSASAIARYGQWSVGTPSANDLATKENAQKRWTEVAKRCRTEVSFFLARFHKD